MLDNLFSKENIALFGVLTLFLWRIIDFILRQKKKRENDLQKLALEMAKYRTDGEMAYRKESFYSYYLFYLDALEKNMKPYNKRSIEIMKDFDQQLTSKINHYERVIVSLNQIEKKLDEKHEITVSDLWDRNLNWARWWRETKLLIRNMLKRKIKYHSFK